MVTRKISQYQTPFGEIDENTWLSAMKQKLSNDDYTLLVRAFELAKHLQSDQQLESGFSFFRQSLNIAEVLSELNLDATTIAASFLMYYVRGNELSSDDIKEAFDNTICKLIEGATRMSMISLSHHKTHKIDNLRKMLLAMVDDIRVVFIKLAEQTFLMRNASRLDEQAKINLAELTFDIYAPLANRLGIGHLKWELEDLAFRYLEPDTYKKIAKSLDTKRIDREHYVEHVKQILTDSLEQNSIKDFEITGRAKHIYSIHKKMLRKGVSYEQIYDVTAVRVLTTSMPDCYAVLSCVHALWQHIPEEFDDYITHPKPNGYRSIHTAVIGPDSKNVEVQIRTYKMHQESELGVAAHWKYKEGAQTESSYEEKIAWLRQLLDWQHELAERSEIQADIKYLFSDRIYVFTPAGDVIDLPKGATALDFAYTIHTQLGHRCKGAKINGNIVPLTYHLQTGDKVDILTGKEPSPSRDWLNQHAGYLTTSKARSKVFHWFKKLDHDKNVAEGRQLFEKELKQLKLPIIENIKIARALKYKTVDDMFAAISHGELKATQLASAIKNIVKVESPEAHEEKLQLNKPSEKSSTNAVKAGDIDNLMSITAKCCKPLPGDEITGFITRGKGITIHRADCINILNTRHPERLLPMAWENQKDLYYPVDIEIKAYDREGLIRDVTTAIANEKIKLLALNTVVASISNMAQINLTVEINSLEVLSTLLDKLNKIPQVSRATRKSL